MALRVRRSAQTTIGVPSSLATQNCSLIAEPKPE
jgi:hypothetical protein